MDLYHVCRVAVAPLRAEASDGAEIVSQLLFGDRVILTESTEKWWKVRTHHDQYEGWLDPKQLQVITSVQFHDEDSYSYLTSANFDNRLKDEQGSFYYLAPGSTLPFFQNGYCYLGDHAFEVITKAVVPDTHHFDANVEEFSLLFLNVPYLWGGRTMFGIDCSGFVQIVYKLLSLSLPRDASQQVNGGEIVDFLSAAKLGDLAFFDNDEGKVIHVGIMLGNDKIIHSSGKVRIDPIDNQGIYNNELEKYSHKLRIIKRYI